MAKTKASWESNVEYHMNKLGYYLEEKIPFHLNRLAKLSDTKAMDQAVNVMDDLCQRFSKALDVFEASISVKPDDEQEEEEEDAEDAEDAVLGRIMKNPDNEDEEPDEEGDEDDEDDGNEEEDNGEDLVNEIFGDE